MCETARTWIEPVVAGAQIASAFYDTGLLMVVKNHYNVTNSSSIANTTKDSEDAPQKAISNFYMIYNLVLGLTPLLSAFIIARLGDMRNRKISICGPLVGYFISRSLLLLVIMLNWPIEVMYGAAALNGLTGGFSAYWSGVMALASKGSSEKRRAVRLITIELTYGLAGFVGSVASGHMFVQLKISKHFGSVLVVCSLAFYAFCILYSLFVLKVPQVTQESAHHTHDQSHWEVRASLQKVHNAGYGSLRTSQSERSPLLHGGEESAVASVNASPAETLPSVNKVTISLLFVAAILYELAVSGGVDVLPIFLIKEPLNWGAEDIGYGNAAGYLVFVTSFLGVFFFSRCLREATMIMIGMLSFCGGMLVMAFVQWTFMYYIARAVMLFALIPLPTIRSVISKHVQGSSYGKVFVILQLCLTLTGVIASTTFIRIYQATLDWFSGFCFILSTIISFLSIIPISIVHHRQSPRETGNNGILTH